MAHEIEVVGGKARMFFVDRLPWHGFGQELTGNPTVAEAITAGGLDWEVELVPLVTADKSQAAPARAVRRVGDGQVLGVVGRGYHPLQNGSAFRFFQPFLDAGLATLHTGGSLSGGRKVWLLAWIEREPLVVGTDDEVRKFVLLSNSHDGTASIRVGFTPIRVVCANTLALAHGGADRLIRVRHTRQLQGRLDALREVMDLADREFAATAERFRFLAGRDISRTDLDTYVRRVFGITAETPNGQQSRILGAVERLFETGRGSDLATAKGTWWGAYNAVTEFLAYERGRGQDTRLNSLCFGDSARRNVDALAAAVALAVRTLLQMAGPAAIPRWRIAAGRSATRTGGL